MTRIVVTEERIAAGVRNHCALCPVALEVQSLLADRCYAYVSTTEVQFVDCRPEKPLMSVGRLSLDVEAMIANYDRGFGMEPFEFELDIPAQMLRE